VGIIGLVGPIGSGCSYVGDLICEEYEYEKISLSDILKEKYLEDHPGSTEDDFKKRSTLQDYGNDLRKSGGNDFLSQLAIKKIRKSKKNFVIDSIRNPGEVECLRKEYANFYLFGIFADQSTRYDRTKEKYDYDFREFEIDDERDSGERDDYGQQVTKCFKGADLVIINNDKLRPGSENEKDFKAKIKEKVSLVQKDIPFRPSPIETYMSMAYAASMRSSCIKRRVGAIIVDETGCVISSGYNEVPIMQKSCLAEYGTCYRGILKRDFKEQLSEIITSEEERDNVFEKFKSNFKILDDCRSLHAEENAIVNIARTGSSQYLHSAILYTTTYPCNLCANKIVQVGIKSLVYFEPYPQKEAKEILAKGKVDQTPFEGVTYNGYFRLMEVVD